MGKKSGRITLLISLATTSALCLAATSAWAQSITVGTVGGTAGQEVAVPVTIQVGGVAEGVAGTQNDITFDPVNTPAGTTCLLDPTQKCTTDQDCITVSGDQTDKCNQPDCTPNAAINKDATAFAFQPPNCVGAACTGLRGLVFSQKAAQANRPIPDGSVLYTCNFKVPSGATGGPFALTVSGVVMSKPANSGCGQNCAIAGATGVNGAISLEPITPGVTPTGGETPGVTPTSGTPGVTPTATGGTAVPTATRTGGATATGGTRTATAVATATAQAVIKLTSAITASATTLTVDNASSLPGSGTVLIDSELINYSGKSGNQLTGLTRGANGTAAAAHEAGARVISVPTGPGVNLDDSDGCQIGTLGGGSAWLLLIPAIGLLAVRRRKH